MRFFRTLALSLALAASTVAAEAKTRDIVDTAVAAGSFKTLVTAVKVAGLVDALKGKGPFTVFAPTDAAFQKLPRHTLTRLLRRGSRERLQAILTYHVVPGRIRAADLLERSSAASLNGQRLPITMKDGRVQVQKASIVATDIACSNGVIHVIDTVMLPAEATVLDTARNAGQFKALLKAVETAGLKDTLQGKGPFTVFAPTDAAFAKLPDGTVAGLLEPENKKLLVAILTRHVSKGRVSAAAALRAGKASMLDGAALPFALRDGRFRIDDARILTADIAAGNGVIHVIDRVLVPPSKADTARTRARDILVLAIDRGVPLFNAGQLEACASIYEVAVRSVAGLSESGISADERQILTGILERLSRSRDARSRAWVLRGAMDRLLERLEARPATPVRKKEKKTMRNEATFKPRIEAALPAGYPQPGPVGEVIVKDYPQYRAARAEGGNSFWTLFNHIKKNKIEMTAPVEMTMAELPNGEMSRTDMAFLYETAEMGKPGRDGSVQVMDLKPVRVLSFGIRGPLTDAKVREAKTAVEKRLGREWKRAGKWRLLGYNSPMVPPTQRFWELQIPVRQ